MASPAEGCLRARARGPSHDEVLITLGVKLPKEAVVDDEVYTYRVTPSTLELWDRIEEDVATWNSSEATNNAASGLS
jgi:hypothetical protein